MARMFSTVDDTWSPLIDTRANTHILVIMPLNATNAPAHPATMVVHSARARLALVMMLPMVLGAMAGCVEADEPRGAVIFEDEFSGSRLDRARWQTEMEWGRKTTGELQRYDDSALVVDGGALTVVASKTPDGDRPYSSGAIATFDRFEFTYGYAEIRARMPSGQGLWPAFWLASTDPAIGSEIDVVEFLGHEPDTVHLAMHYDSDGEHFEPQVTYRGEDFTRGWHTFGVEWSPGAVVWYVDGVERARRVVGVPSTPMYLIANMAVGGEWPGDPDPTTEFPASYEIDYIRVYER